jgi:hypothetical protein
MVLVRAQVNLINQISWRCGPLLPSSGGSLLCCVCTMFLPYGRPPALPRLNWSPFLLF